MDTLPDFEPPKTPKGFRFIGVKHPEPGDYIVDFYDKPYLIRDEKHAQNFVEKQWCFRPI